MAITYFRLFEDIVHIFFLNANNYIIHVYVYMVINNKKVRLGKILNFNKASFFLITIAMRCKDQPKTTMLDSDRS